jgi:hypothetical protein
LGYVVSSEPGGSFYRAVNLGGPSKIINGEAWESNLDVGAAISAVEPYVVDTPNFSNEGGIQCASWLTLTPAASSTAQGDMLRCWRNHWAHNLLMTNVPAGQYDVSLYVVQSYAEANPTTFSVLMQNVGCLTHNVGSQAGRWWRLTCAVSAVGASEIPRTDLSPSVSGCSQLLAASR